MHTDPELLGLLALGEAVGDERDREHTRTCPQCAEELAELEHLVTLGRSSRHEAALVEPSADVWARIHAELSLGSASSDGTAEVPAHSAAARELTAHAQLVTTAEPSWVGPAGRADVATDEQGRRLLEVLLQSELPETGVRQAWLVHRDDPTRRQTLGILDGQHGLWTIDHAIDLQQFTILDISQQEIGEVEHSGRTIARGELTLAG